MAGSSARLLGAAVAALLACTSAFAQVSLPPENEPEARGLAIAEEMDRRDRGWGDATADMKMILTNATGATSERELRLSMMERTGEGEGDWSLIVFDRPLDVAGTALLTHAYVAKPDDQWLFLPAVKRVRRISSANKSGPFVGSEFAFEDLAPQETGKFTWVWLRDEPCGERSCHVVDRIPAYEGSGYTHQTVWIDTDHYLLRKIDYYDRKSSLLKTLTAGEYDQYLDSYWRPRDLDMVNHESRKQTKLVWQKYQFRTGLKESDFTPAALERTR
ncbi:outer membrane lipoprotein-sorting protein [Parvibaculum sp.]|uniref:outer membrane lipoprotein-sorting protein n=1 Tax=Parvibaculum sp. TaxID=2024848 RepID=UPI002A25BFA0|nr:outer membrane lipoprotein-sorting protein [Parvibaculum sp.]